MCAFESLETTATDSDEYIVAQALESMSALLHAETIGPDEISKALETLTALKKRLEEAEQEKLKLEAQIQRDRNTIENRTSHQQRLDHEIIEAKMQASELLASRDTIARDLARANKSLQSDKDLFADPESILNDIRNRGQSVSLDASYGHSNGHETQHSNSRRMSIAAVGANQPKNSDYKADIIEEEDPEKLARCIASEMEQLTRAEKQLIDVVDDTSSVKRRRKELEKKMKIAREEW